MWKLVAQPHCSYFSNKTLPRAEVLKSIARVNREDGLGFPRPRISKPCPEVIKLFSCSTQLSMKFLLLINVKMPTIIVGIFKIYERKK